MNWRDEVIDQLDFYWENHLWNRLEGLTDDEYFWEPVPGCWNIRRQDDGTFQIDWEWPAPELAPVTTIAWRLAHVGPIALGMRVSSHFGDGPLDLATIQWPGTADEALDVLSRTHKQWRDGVTGMNEETLLAPVGPAEGAYADRPFATLVLHLNREIMHHGGEIGLLRDLYRAKFTSKA